MEHAEIEALARKLLSACETGQMVPTLPSAHSGFDLSAAYEVEAQLKRLREASGAQAVGRKVGYADAPHNQRTPEIDWLRANPHRLHLGQIGFVLTKADGDAAQTNDLTDIEQTLELCAHGPRRLHVVLVEGPASTRSLPATGRPSS